MKEKTLQQQISDIIFQTVKQAKLTFEELTKAAKKHCKSTSELHEAFKKAQKELDSN